MNSRNNYFIKLIKYIKNVYHIDKQISLIRDNRKNPTYKTSQIISLVLTGFLLRVQSFNQLNNMIKTDDFNNVCSSEKGIPKIDAIRNSLQSIDLNALQQVIEKTVNRAVRIKVLDKGTIDYHIVAAIDGTNMFHTQSPHCDDCILKRNKGKIYYSHSCIVMSLIGDGPNLVLDFEMNKHKNKPNDTGEGELAAAKRLLYRVITAHKGLVDVVTYDSLACGSPFIKACDSLDVDAIIRVKNNHNLAIRRVKKLTNKKKPIKYWNDGEYKIEAYESIFYMDGVEAPLRFLKFAKEKRNGKRSQVMIVTTAIDMRIKTVYKIMKARWHIENRVFNNLKTYANLDHCFVHGGNAVEAILYLMFISSNLLNLFKERRLKNHISDQTELVRLLNRGLYQLGRNAITILNSA